MVSIQYGSVAIGADESFAATLQNCAIISNMDDLMEKVVSGYINYGNPCENYSVLLDRSCRPIPKDTSGVNIGVWSDLSDADGKFSSKPTISLMSDTPYELSGISFEFDTFLPILPTTVTISWYLGDLLKASGTYDCTSSNLNISQKVDECDKIVISVDGINAPFARIKFRKLVYGAVILIEGREISNVQITQEVCPISTTLPISTADITLLVKSGADYKFTESQEIAVYDDSRLIGTFFIDEASRVTERQWRIRAQDYIGLMDSISFPGGMYEGWSGRDTVGTIANEIFNAAGIGYSIVYSDFENQYIEGLIKETTCRNALQQLLFAAGGFARTAYSNVVELLPVQTDVSETIPLGRVMQGTQTSKSDPSVTEVEVVAHKYRLTGEEKQLFSADDETENLKIKFGNPVYKSSLSLTNDGEPVEDGIVESNSNYAIIVCPAGSVLSGWEYDHTTLAKSKVNTAIRAAKSNKKTISDATLVSVNNLDEVLQRSFDYLVGTLTVSSKVIESEEPILPGEKYQLATEMWGDVVGTNVKQTFSLQGNGRVVKKIELKE